MSGSISQLLARVRAGDRVAADKLLERYRSYYRVIAQRSLVGRIGRRLDPSDVIQATYIDALQKVDQFRGTTEGEFIGWVKAILKNNLHDAAREHSAQQRDLDREWYFDNESETVAIQWIDDSDQTTPASRVIRGERAMALLEVMQKLTPDQRRVIELRHLQGLKIAEIAVEMERTPAAVIAVSGRAMKALESLMQGLMDEL